MSASAKARVNSPAYGAVAGTGSAAPEGSTALTADDLHAISRAIADPKRFAILQQIAASEAMMCSDLDIQEELSPATISHHLRELQEAGLVDSRRDGRRMCLKLRRSVWNAYLRYLQQL